MKVIVAERGQITLPKAVRDALGLTKGTTLKVELDGGRILLRKDVSEALRKVRGKFKLVDGMTSTDQALRAIRGRAPGEPLDISVDAWPVDARQTSGDRPVKE